MEQQLSVEELRELLYWAEKKEEMKKTYQKEMLKEQEDLERKKKEMKQQYLAEELKERKYWEKKTADMKERFLANFLKDKEDFENKITEMKQKNVIDFDHEKARECMETDTKSRKRAADDEEEPPAKKMKSSKGKAAQKNVKRERLDKKGKEKISLPKLCFPRSQTGVQKIRNANVARPQKTVADDSKNIKTKSEGGKKDCVRLFYGKHQIQVLAAGGDAELRKHFVECEKNPGHSQFLPINVFNAQHLPDGYRDNDIVGFIKATADLTIRVDVNRTSPKRPQFWPKTTIRYPFYEASECGAMRTGTGVVWRVDKGKDTRKNKNCECLNCRNSNTPSKEWGKVRMYTAAQLVFDDLEAGGVSCRLFFDSQDSPLVTLTGWAAVKADIGEDRCWLECVTCDVALLSKLDKMTKLWNKQRYTVNKKYENSNGDNKPVFIVSHPHGCPKMVSVGRLIYRNVIKDGKTKYTYSASTCPGSTGAYVNSICCNEGTYYDHHLHAGVNSEGTNFSGPGRDASK